MGGGLRTLFCFSRHYQRLASVPVTESSLCVCVCVGVHVCVQACTRVCMCVVSGLVQRRKFCGNSTYQLLITVT